jgi:ABC-2 type transport system ATP-binding protein
VLEAPSAPADVVLDLRDLTRDFGATRALSGVSLAVRRGEVFGYLGANGAGKTTTIKILTGLLHPTSGDAFVCGHSVTTAPLEAKARLGYLPESGALFEKLSPLEYLVFTGQLYGLEEGDAQERARHWLSFFSLLDKADHRIGTFSKGTKQKVCWAAALQHEPEVLVLDEPLNGLDVETVARLKELLRSWSAAGRTVFYSSHLVDVVEKMCTRVGVLHGGRLVGEGTVDEVRTRAGASSLEEALMILWQRPTDPPR